MSVNNKQMVDAIVENGSPALKQAFSSVDTGDNAQVYSVLKSFEQVQNEFISTLVNRVVKTQFFTKVYNNPLRMLHNGMLGFGDSIQQIFTHMGQRKGFNDHFNSGGTAENDLIGKRVPQVDVDYIQKNFAHKYKVSISELQLKQAFLSENGLASLCNDLMSNNLSTAYYDEYNDMVGILTRAAAETSVTDGHKFEQGIVQQIVADSELSKTAVIPLGANWSPTKLCEKIRATAGNMAFPTTKYNLAKVRTWSDKSDLIFFTTPDVSANIDVNVLAQAFNVSHTDVNIRTIEIDSLPTTAKGNVLGIIADKNLIQAWDIINTAKTFENGDALYTNYFLHKQGIMASCKFAQCVVITDGATA